MKIKGVIPGECACLQANETRDPIKMFSSGPGYPPKADSGMTIFIFQGYNCPLCALLYALCD